MDTNRIATRDLDGQSFSLDQRLQLLDKNSDFCMAYLTLQEGLNYFDVPHSEAYIAFRPTAGRAVMLANPVGDIKTHRDVIVSFIAYCKDHKLKPIAVESSEETGKIFAEQGFYVNEMGVETRIALPTFTLDGKDKEKLRRWRNTAKKAGMSVEEKTFSQINSGTVQAVSDEWLHSKKGKKEVSFLIDTMQYQDLPFSRNFYGFIGEKLVGFVTFYQMKKNGKVVGYYQNHMRDIVESPNGTVDYITLEAMDKFKSEGIPMLDLGMSPLWNINETGDKYSDPTNILFNVLYHSKFGNNLYPFKGNHFHKENYHGQEQKVYFISPKNGVLDIAILMKKIGLY